VPGEGSAAALGTLAETNMSLRWRMTLTISTVADASPSGTYAGVEMVEQHHHLWPAEIVKGRKRLAGSCGGLTSSCYFGCNSVQIARLSSKQVALPLVAGSATLSSSAATVEIKLRASILPRSAKKTLSSC
jgi:hypothetical protein